jgi:hypothetical protein
MVRRTSRKVQEKTKSKQQTSKKEEKIGPRTLMIEYQQA